MGSAEGNLKAWFRATREICGLTQQNVADAAGVRIMTVKRWEKQGQADPPEDVCDWLSTVRRAHDAAVDDICRTYLKRLRAAPEEHPVIPMEIWRNQEDADNSHVSAGREGSPYGYVNAIRKSAAERLRGMGVGVVWRFPEDGEPASGES